MKVILKQSVPKLGKEGQVVTVKDGYARNFLFPQGMAIIADKVQLKVLDRRNAKESARLAETKASAEATSSKLNGSTIKIGAKVGRDAGKLFGAITAQDIADEAAKQLDLKLEKKQVLLLAPIKKLGRHDVELDIHKQVSLHITVNVYDLEHPETANDPVEEAVEEVATVEA
jgi:large subunit ribosomal protein L9